MEASPIPPISLIIPTLNEAKRIEACLQAALRFVGPCEIIVTDGGSEDGTLERCQKYASIHCLSTGRGRALQMNAAAAVAKGEYLFFLHADTLPPKNSLQLIHQGLNQPSALAGSFYLQFDRSTLAYRLLSQLTRLNVAWMTYGDQGLFLRRSTFEEMGGFANISFMEDLEIQRRLRKKGRFVKLEVPLITAARRFERNGLFWQLMIDFFLMLAYYLGISPERLKEWYPDYSEDKVT